MYKYCTFPINTKNNNQNFFSCQQKNYIQKIVLSQKFNLYFLISSSISTLFFFDILHNQTMFTMEFLTSEKLIFLFRQTLASLPLGSITPQN